MGFVVRVYDRGNNLLAELDNLENCKRSWVLNKYAGATIPIPINHPKATEDILAKGNRVLVLSDLGVEPWGGLIGVARGWDTTKIEVTCLSMAAMWERRKIRAADFTAYTPGQVFTEAVGIANGVEHTGIIAGSVVAGGPTLELHPRLQNVYKFMGDLQQMCGYDWYLSYDADTRLWQDEIV